MNNCNYPEALNAFPKVRPELPEKYRRIFHEHYVNNRSSKGIVGRVAHRLESWMHLQVAGDIKDIKRPYSTLELGAGNLNHLPYEDTEQKYDVVEPYTELYELSPDLGQVHRVYQDISEAEGRYDRIISIATFEHLTHLPAVIARCGLLLNTGGCLRAAVPAEGSILWKTAYTVSTGLVFFLRYRMSYETLMRHEHINSWKEIATVLNYFFQDIDSSCLGLSPGFSLYHFYCCQNPRIERCKLFLSREQGGS